MYQSGLLAAKMIPKKSDYVQPIRDCAVVAASITSQSWTGLLAEQYWQGRPVVQLVKQVPHIQRLCPCHSGHGFDSTCGTLLHVIPSLCDDDGVPAEQSPSSLVIG